MNLRIYHIILIFLIFFTLPPVASAHRVVIFAWIEGDTVFTESQFADGKKVVGGQVTVYDLGGNILLDGKTNTNGEFSFKIPQPAGMRIVLAAGMGHQGEWTLSDAEVSGASDLLKTPIPENPADETVVLSDDMSASASSRTPQPEQAGSFMDEKQIEQIVERVLDRKLKPVTRMLAQMHHSGPTLSDIFGGIGYILGLMGIAMYFYSRKKRD
jgi:nickel transport protein